MLLDTVSLPNCSPPRALSPPLTNLENILAATKRTVPKPLLQFAMSLPWNESRPY